MPSKQHPKYNVILSKAQFQLEDACLSERKASLSKRSLRRPCREYHPQRDLGTVSQLVVQLILLGHMLKENLIVFP